MITKTTALYVRVSTDDQAREGWSIDAQIEKLTSYAKFQGWVNVEVFADEGESGKDMRRPQMERLIKLIKAKKISTVCTIAVDRLSRNLLDMLQFIDLCERHSTAYVCPALNFDTSTPIGRMTLQILASFAEFERAMISVRVKDTMLSISTNKKKFLSVPPYGYKFDDNKNLIIEPEKAEWIKTMVDYFIEGHGYRAVAKMLTERGVKTNRGYDWTSSSVRWTLTNEIYVGRTLWNRRYYNKEGKAQWREPEQWIVNGDTHPAILTSDQWEAIQKRLTRKMPRGGQATIKYKLSGLLKCAYCGSKMTGRRYNNRGEERIYVCSSYQKNGGCKFNHIFTLKCEEVVCKFLDSLTLDTYEPQILSPSEIKKDYESEFIKRENLISQRMQRQLMAFEEGLLSLDDLRIAKERVEKERLKLQEDRENALNKKENNVAGLLKKEAANLLWLWNNESDLSVLQNSLRLFFKSIIVKDREIIEVALSEAMYH